MMINEYRGFRKILASINLIVVSAVFIACSIYTVNVLANGPSDTFLLKYKDFPISKAGAAETGYPNNRLFVPGYYYESKTEAILENSGNGRAFAELTIPRIYLTRDKNGNMLDTPVLAPPGFVTINVDIVTVSAIDGSPLNRNYVNNRDDFEDTYGDKGLIHHRVLRDTNDPNRKILRHFFEFDKIYTESKLDSSGNIVYENVNVRLALKWTIDMRTRADEMTNEWNGAIVEDFGFRATSADDVPKILEMTGMTCEEYCGLRYPFNTNYPVVRSFSIVPL